MHTLAHAIATRRRRDGMHCHLKLLHPRRNVRRRATAACGVFDAVPFAVRSRATLAAPAATSHGQRLARQGSSDALGSQPLPTALAPAEILSKRSLAKASAEHGEGGARGWPAKALTCSATAHASQATK